MTEPLWRTVWRFFKKLELELPCDPEILLLGIYPEKTINERDTSTLVFAAALFTIAKTRKLPRCPSTYEWIQKLCYMYTVEGCSALKKNTFESVLMRWMNLKPIVQSKLEGKDKYCILTHVYRI